MKTLIVITILLGGGSQQCFSKMDVHSGYPIFYTIEEDEDEDVGPTIPPPPPDDSPGERM